MKQPIIDAKIVNAVYNNYATIYDLLFTKVLDPARKKAIQQMDFKPDEKVIELGVGTGLSFKHYNSLNQKIFLTGVDLSDKMLEKAKQRTSEFPNLEITLARVDAENSPYEDGSFDKVILMYVYSVTPNPLKLLSEAIRICKDTGSIHIINHFSHIGNSSWRILENALSNFSAKIGFRSNFSYIEYIKDLNLNIESESNSNLFSLTKVIVLKKKKNTHFNKSIINDIKATHNR
jgi:phosphatidylethanolamine/phosphatidyl-N-methylethanolamine N-methyltransferase